MERIQDLLKLESSNLKVRQAIDGGILIEGLTEVTVQSKVEQHYDFINTISMQVERHI